MTNIPKLNQVPIQQPMYVNGVLQLAWIRFFETLGNFADVGESVDLTRLEQTAIDLVRQIGVINQELQDIERSSSQMNTAISSNTKKITTLNGSVTALQDSDVQIFKDIAALEQAQAFAVVSLNQQCDTILSTMPVPTGEII